MPDNSARFAALLICTTLVACARAPEPQIHALPVASADPTTPEITIADLKHRLYLIADDSMGGRATGSVGHNKTVQYIAAELKRLGLEPAGEKGTYLQRVPFARRSLQISGFSVNGQALQRGSDLIVPVSASALKPLVNAPVTYGGVFTDSSTWITGEQAAGKFVILNVPAGHTRFYAGFNNHPRWSQSAGVAVTGYGALFTNLSRYFPESSLVYKNPKHANNVIAPGLYLSDAAAEKLIGIALAAAKPGAIGQTLNGTFEFTETASDVYNVMGILRGSDSKLRNSYVAVGAHSDHVGQGGRAVDHDSAHIFMAARRKAEVEKRQISPAEVAALNLQLDSIRKLRPPRPDTIRNGADDDGSGTSATLEIAEAMARSKTKPKRSILFIWHAAEELGMIGSGYFTDHPTVARDSIIAKLNMDMIGRGSAGEEPAGGPDYLQLIGWRRLSNELGDLIDIVNNERKMPFKFDLEYDKTGHPEQYYCRSDHYSYAKWGIPISFFSTGSHGDYHQVTDEPQYIDYTKLLNVSQFVHDIALRLGNRETRLKVDGKVTGPDAPCVQ